MKIWVGVTDKDWFQFLSRINPDEVNFWQPSGSRVFRALQPGELLLLKLHSPDNFVVGGGHFVRYSALPASLAWDAFGPKNGVGSLEELGATISASRCVHRSCDRAQRPRRTLLLRAISLDPVPGKRHRIMCQARPTTRRWRTAAHCGVPSKPRSPTTRRLENLRCLTANMTKIGSVPSI